jgi:hypothetical protein
MRHIESRAIHGQISRLPRHQSIQNSRLNDAKLIRERPALLMGCESSRDRQGISTCPRQHSNSESESRCQPIPHSFSWSHLIGLHTVHPSTITSPGAGLSRLCPRIQWASVATQEHWSNPDRISRIRPYPSCPPSQISSSLLLRWPFPVRLLMYPLLLGLSLPLSLGLSKNTCLQRELTSAASGFERQCRGKERRYRQINQVEEGMHERLSVRNREECYGTGKPRRPSQPPREMKETKSRSFFRIFRRQDQIGDKGLGRATSEARGHRHRSLGIGERSE